ncbi:MAG: hypothetical protein GY703_24790, partial [Gammaproteobacteria bacterium]|nr:hypothetical protein [Gammaproteobacteria bacterium]
MADERFQDFNEKTNPDSTDELVGVDDTGYIRVPFSSINPVFTGDGNGDGMVKDPDLGPSASGFEYLSITGDFTNPPTSPVGGLSGEF